MISTVKKPAEFQGRQRPTHPIVHPAIVRITHWVNAVAMIMMILSGWAVHNAYPTLPFLFPEWMTLGGSLSGGLQWHFAAMWLLAINGLVYVTYGLISGRFRRKLWPIRVSDLFADLRAAFTGRLGHADLSVYNSIQKLLYFVVIVTGNVLVLTGLSIWKPVQFEPLTALFGDFDNARIIHFLAMSVIVLFLIVHVAMSLLVPRSLLSMIRGR
jgi:thiosulfate reductase cytochrome b subunit